MAVKGYFGDLSPPREIFCYLAGNLIQFSLLAAAFCKTTINFFLVHILQLMFPTIASYKGIYSPDTILNIHEFVGSNAEYNGRI